MSDRIISVQAIDQRYDLPQGAGSDSLHVDPQYSYAVTLLQLADGEYGTGLAFTLGRGNEVVVKAIEAYAPFLVGQDLNAIMGDLARFWRRLADESQLRWLGPHKGVVHLALASITSALVDAWAIRRQKPLWQLLLEMSPEALIEWVDLAYLEDFLTHEEALEIPSREAGAPWQKHDLIVNGYPAYNTAVGWLGYDRDLLVRNCREQLEAGFGALKLKVGSATLQEDVDRIGAVRGAVGPDIRLMLDANQKWTVEQAIAAGRALQPFAPFWLEEPTHPDDILGFRDIARGIAPLKVAGGEHVANAVLFKNLLRAEAVHFVQADIVRLGGLPEFLAVMLMSRKAGLPVVPHAGDMSQIHQHLAVWQSIRLGVEPYHLEYIPHLREHFVTPIRVEGGRYQLPRVPGSSTRLVGVTPSAGVDYLAERARRGDRSSFERALAKVPDVEPEDYDKL
jgi:L-fuconate dehydratase